MGIKDLLSAWLDFEAEVSLKIFDCIFVFKVCKVIVNKKTAEALAICKNLQQFFYLTVTAYRGESVAMKWKGLSP